METMSLTFPSDVPMVDAMWSLVTKVYESNAVPVASTCEVNRVGGTPTVAAARKYSVKVERKEMNYDAA